MKMETIRSVWKGIFGKFSKVSAWLVSIILVLILLFQFAVAGGIAWLNSADGQAIITKQIAQIAEQNGYEIEISKLGFSFPHGLQIDAIKVADAQGQIAEVQDLVVRPALISMGMRALEIAVSMERLTVYRIPESEKEDTAEDEAPFALQPFTLPDIYFTRFALNDLAIKRLEIMGEGEEAEQPAQIYSPRLTVGVTLGEELTLNVILNLDNPPPALPRHIRMFGHLNTQTAKGYLETLEINNPGYDLTAEGGFDLGENGVWDIKAEGMVNDFSKLSEGLNGKAKLSAALNGPLNTPAVMADVIVTLDMLKERGLDDVRISLSDSDITTPPMGRVILNTNYQERPIELAADFNLEEGVLSVTEIQGTAPELSVSGALELDTETILASGIINLNINDFTPYSELAGVDIKGAAKADIHLIQNNDAQSLSIDGKLTNLAYADMTVSSAALQANVPDISKTWPESLSLKVERLRIIDNVGIATLNADLSPSGDDSYKLSLDAKGRALQRLGVDGTVVLSGVKNGEMRANDMNFVITSDGSQARLTGQIDQQTLDVNLRADGFKLPSDAFNMPEQLRGVALSGDIKASGPMAAPIINAELAATPITVVKEEAITLQFKGGYAEGAAKMAISGHAQAVEQMDGTITLPMQLALLPFKFDLPSSTPLDGSLQVNANAGGLAALFLPAGQRMSGAMDLDVVLGGTIAAPDMQGQLALQNGTYEHDSLGARLQDMQLRAVLNAEAVSIETLSANDGNGGQLRGSGVLGITSNQSTNLDLELENFQITGSDAVQGSFSADLGFSSQNEGYVLNGDIQVGEVSVIIPERFQSAIPELNIVKKDEKQEDQQLKQIALDISVEADNKIFVRGWGLDAEFGGNIDVTGTLNQPLMNGVMSARRGRYEELGRRFELDQAYLRFQGAVPPSPYLDITATTDADDIDATIKLTGPVTKPVIGLSSTPSLPQDEIMSRVLFGENIQNITPFQAIQLKQTLDRFTGRGGGGFDALGKLRELTGVDDIRVDSDADGETTAGVGKYLTDKVYLELEKGAGENSGAAKVQVEVTPSISIESEVGQDAQAGAGVLWKWDY